MDDSTRRLLRFSIFLQGFALAMFTGVIVIQFATGTTSVLTWVFGVVAIALVAAIIGTRRLTGRT